jgi:hypothetical protein
MRFEHTQNSYILRVAFFGHVQYVLISPALSKDVIENLKRNLEIDDLQMIMIKMMIEEGKTVWGFKNDEDVVSFESE